MFFFLLLVEWEGGAESKRAKDRESESILRLAGEKGKLKRYNNKLQIKLKKKSKTPNIIIRRGS